MNVTILILQGRQEGKEERKGIVNLFPGVYSSSSKLNFFKVFRMEEGEEANLKNEYFNRSARQCFYEFLIHKFLDNFFFVFNPDSPCFIYFSPTIRRIILRLTDKNIKIQSIKIGLDA